MRLFKHINAVSTMAKKTAILLFVSVFASSSFLLVEGSTAATTPALFVFGDSTADVGSNNYLPQDAPKSNFSPYGIDFPGQIPTGRFSNGFIGVDYIAKAMGLRRSPPPLLSATANDLGTTRGVNFASAGSGILDDTGKDVLTMATQVEEFRKVAGNLTAIAGGDFATQFLGKSLIFLSLGSNDLFAQFAQLSLLGPVSDAQKDQIVAFIINKFNDQLKMLYDLGGRKYAVAGTGMIGCVPTVRLLSPQGDCNEELNDLSRRFKIATKALLEELSAALEVFKYSFGDSYEFGITVRANPTMFGFRELKSACCGGGRLNAEIRCGPNTAHCSNRRQHFFWDFVHPTRTAYKWGALLSLYGPPQFANPVNIQQLLLC